MAGAPEPKSESRIASGEEQHAGAATDRQGNAAVDPTKNVLDLVRAESKYQDYAREAVASRANDLRAAETRRVDQMFNAESRRVDSVLEAETRRQDELRIATTRSDDALRAQRMTFEQRIEFQASDFQKQMAAQANDYQKQISAIIASQTDKSAILLSQAVDKLAINTGERLAAVEKNQYVTGGTAAVRDPQLAADMASLTATVAALAKAGSKIEGKETGRGEIIAWAVTAVTVVAALAALFAKFSV